MEATLSANEAAERAGMSPVYFRQVMSRLNNTSRDLRAPATPGERARRYDPVKLDSWVSAGRPTAADSGEQATDAMATRTVKARAARSPSAGWSVDVEELGVMIAARTLDQARTLVRQQASSSLDIAQEGIAIELEISLDEPAAQTVKEYEEVRTQLKSLEEHSASLQARSVSQLREQEFTMAEIARVLRVSMQRVQQIDVANRGQGTSHQGQAAK